MKRILSVLLVLVLALTLLVSCKDPEGPANDPENKEPSYDKLYEAIVNTSAKFDSGIELPTFPEITDSAEIEIKAEMPAYLGISIDAGILFSMKDKEKPFFGIDLKKFEFGEIKVNNAAAYLNLNEIALKFADAKTLFGGYDGFAGFSYTDIPYIINYLTGKEPDAETSASLDELYAALEQAKAALAGIPDIDSSVISGAPDLTKENYIALLNIAKSKNVLSANETETGINYAINVNLAAMGEIAKEFIAELRKDAAWTNIFNEIEDALFEANQESVSIEEIIDTVIEETETEFEASAGEIVYNYYFTVELTGEEKTAYLKDQSSEIKVKEKVFSTSKAVYTISDKSSVAFESILNNNDGTPSQKAELSIQKAETTASCKYIINIVSSTANESGVFEFPTEAELTFETDSSKNSFLITATTNDGIESESITLGGTFVSSEKEMKLTLNAVGLGSLGVTVNPKFELTLKPASNKNFPNYKHVSKLSEEQIKAYLAYFGSFAEATVPRQ